MDEENAESKLEQKIEFELSTNVCPKNKIRRVKVYKEVPLSNFMELYEQIFGIDLYAYRVSFLHEKKAISKLEDIEELEQAVRDNNLKLELFVEYAGG